VLLVLFGTYGPKAQIVMSSTTSSTNAILRLAKICANRSRTRIISLKERLFSITKGDSNACDYLCSIRSVGDELALIGHCVDDLDLIIVALNGLGPAYCEFCAAIYTCDILLLFDELFDKLVDCEIFLQREERQQSSLPVTINYVSCSSFSHGCYKHSMSSPSRVSPAQDNLSNSHPRNSSFGSHLICQYCDRRGHTTKTCYKLHGYPSDHSRHQANTINKDSNFEPSWLLNFCASHHVIGNLANLTLAHDYTGNDKLMVVNGKGLTITHNGSTALPFSSSSLHLNIVLYIPNISQNLLSIFQLCQSNFISIEFFPWHFQIKDLSTGAIILHGKNENNVYKISCLPPHPQSHHIHCHSSFSTWHSHLRHPTSSILHHAPKANVIPFYSSYVQCSDCLAHKSHKLPFSKSTLSSSQALELIYSDVWGPAPSSSINGHFYYVIFINHFSICVWLYPIKDKYDFFHIFPILKSLVENQLNTKIKTFYSDNGHEYLTLRSFFQTHGITHLTTLPYILKYNEFSKRKHRHLIETTRCLLYHASLPFHFGLMLLKL